MNFQLGYKSYADLSKDVFNSLGKIPNGVDLVVGVPRSGLMVATMIALNLNLRVCDVGSFLRNDSLKTGSTRSARGGDLINAHDATNILVVEDSIHTGLSLATVKSQILSSGYQGTVTYMAIYATEGSVKKVDIYGEIFPMPRLFQWNACHRKDLENFCFDIDGILCKSPTTEQSSNELAYADFIQNAPRFATFTYKIGHLVTSRPEKYRTETEIWLRRHSITYGTLHMSDHVTEVERDTSEQAALFKAKVYASIPQAELFFESNHDQAVKIADVSGKPVLDFGNQILITPLMSMALLKKRGRTLADAASEMPSRLFRKLSKTVAKFFA